MYGVSLDHDGFVIDGRRQVLLAGSLFYFRVPRSAWRDRMEKLKLAGYRALDVYFPWNFHEPAEGEWDFAGEKDIHAFLSLAEELDLYVVARPGPYICSEWDGGGLPAYLFSRGMRVRDNDPAFLSEVKRWFDRILPILRTHTRPSGGCVIAVQLENELDFYSDAMDRVGYIAALRDMALAAGIDVPLFCCAGQGGLDAACALGEGVFPSMNFYPSYDDIHFGEQARYYQAWLSGRSFPLLVTETNREHQFLRLLLLLGAKLIAPYNQAGGTDFGFTTSVNNWGEPVAFQTSDYDFASMISPSGEFDRRMLLEARVLRGMIDSLPGLVEARPCPLPTGFLAPDWVFATALKLPGGGVVVGGMKCGGGPADVAWPDGRMTFEPGKCAFAMAGVSLRPMGTALYIDFANAAPVFVSPSRVVFAAEQPEIFLRLNGRRMAMVPGSEVDVDGVCVALLPWEEATRLSLPERASRSLHLPLSYATFEAGCPFESLPDTPVGEDLSLEANGVLRGWGEYRAEVDLEDAVGVLMPGAGDVIGVSLDGRDFGVFAPAGWPLYVPVKGLSGERLLRVRAEIWGHSNFDDLRAPCMKIGSTRGVREIIAVRSAERIPLWIRTDEVAGRAPQLTALGSWLTAHSPARGAFEVVKPALCEARWLHFEGLKANVQVRVNGCSAGFVDIHHQWLDISGLPAECEKIRLECLVEQRDYTEPCGVPILYQGDRIQNVSIARMGEAELPAVLRLLAGEKILTLPLALKTGRGAVLCGILEGTDLEMSIEGCQVKATVLRGGHVCGRLVLGAEGLPAPRGGRPNIAYLPACWGDDLVVYLEGLGDGARLSSIAFRTLGTYRP